MHLLKIYIASAVQNLTIQSKSTVTSHHEASLLVIVHHTAKTLCFLQEFQPFIDLGEGQFVCNVVVQIDRLQSPYGKGVSGSLISPKEAEVYKTAI
jgi:hypothetical protein